MQIYVGNQNCSNEGNAHANHRVQMIRTHNMFRIQLLYLIDLHYSNNFSKI